VRRYWSEAESSLLAEMYPHCHTADVAAWIGRTERQVFQAAFLRRLTKTPEYLASVASGRVQTGKLNPRMVASQFKPGLVPWNKGRDSRETGTGHHPNSRRNQFCKGRPPHLARNYQPIGAERICADGYLERKVTDDHPVPARRWVAVHRLVWEAERGPIPKGYIVRFKPGMKTTVAEEITAERLECISRADNGRRTHPANRDPELFKLIQLKGAISRQVNRISREAQE
jgi:hypothetical protein